MDDPTKPQVPAAPPPVTPGQPSAPTPPVSPAPPPVPTEMPQAATQHDPVPTDQSTMPPITHTRRNAGKIIAAGVGTLVVLAIVGTVLVVSQKSAKQATVTNTSANAVSTAPTAIPSPTVLPESPEGVQQIDAGTGTEGIDDIKKDASGL